MPNVLFARLTLFLPLDLMWNFRGNIVVGELNNAPVQQTSLMIWSRCNEIEFIGKSFFFLTLFPDHNFYLVRLNLKGQHSTFHKIQDWIWNSCRGTRHIEKVDDNTTAFWAELR